MNKHAILIVLVAIGGLQATKMPEIASESEAKSKTINVSGDRTLTITVSELAGKNGEIGWNIVAKISSSNGKAVDDISGNEIKETVKELTDFKGQEAIFDKLAASLNKMKTGGTSRSSSWVAIAAGSVSNGQGQVKKAEIDIVYLLNNVGFLEKNYKLTKENIIESSSSTKDNVQTFDVVISRGEGQDPCCLKIQMNLQTNEVSRKAESNCQGVMDHSIPEKTVLAWLNRNTDKAEGFTFTSENVYKINQVDQGEIKMIEGYVKNGNGICVLTIYYNTETKVVEYEWSVDGCKGIYDPKIPTFSFEDLVPTLREYPLITVADQLTAGSFNLISTKKVDQTTIYEAQISYEGKICTIIVSTEGETFSVSPMGSGCIGIFSDENSMVDETERLNASGIFVNGIHSRQIRHSSADYFIPEGKTVGYYIYTFKIYNKGSDCEIRMIEDKQTKAFSPKSATDGCDGIIHKLIRI